MLSQAIRAAVTLRSSPINEWEKKLWLHYPFHPFVTEMADGTLLKDIIY